MLGFDALGRLALGELTSSAGPSIVTAIAFAAGVGTAFGIGTASASSVGSGAGAGVASGVLRATSSSVGFAAGIGAALGFGNAIWPVVGYAVGSSSASGVSNPIAAAIAFAAGHGNAYAISYAFFLDGEIVCVQDEPRTTSVSEENRLLIVPWSAREQEAAPSDQNANTLNRMRTC